MVTLTRYYAKTLADLGTNKVVALLPAGRLWSFSSQAMKQYANGGQEGGISLNGRGLGNSPREQSFLEAL